MQDPTATRCACDLLAVVVSREGLLPCPWRLPGLDAIDHLCLAATSTMTSPMVADGTILAAIAWLHPRQQDVFPFPRRSVVGSGGRGPRRPRPPPSGSAAGGRGARRPRPCCCSTVSGGRGARCPRSYPRSAVGGGRERRRPHPPLSQLRCQRQRSASSAPQLVLRTWLLLVLTMMWGGWWWLVVGGPGGRCAVALCL